MFTINTIMQINKIIPIIIEFTKIISLIFSPSNNACMFVGIEAPNKSGISTIIALCKIS